MSGTAAPRDSPQRRRGGIASPSGDTWVEGAVGTSVLSPRPVPWGNAGCPRDPRGPADANLGACVGAAAGSQGPKVTSVLSRGAILSNPQGPDVVERVPGKAKKRVNERERKEAARNRAIEKRRERVARRAEATHAMYERGMTRGQIRLHWKKCARRQKHREKHKWIKNRKLVQLRELMARAGKKTKLRVARIKGGTWNTRGWGAKYARIDQYMKTECLLA
jgi:hypothetical protein